MGNCKKRPRTLLSAYSTIGIPIQCPKCGYKFPPATSYEAVNILFPFLKKLLIFSSISI